MTSYGILADFSNFKEEGCTMWTHCLMRFSACNPRTLFDPFLALGLRHYTTWADSVLKYNTGVLQCVFSTESRSGTISKDHIEQTAAVPCTCVAAVPVQTVHTAVHSSLNS